MNENLFIYLFIHGLKFHQIMHDMTMSTHQQLLTNRISWASVVSHAINSSLHVALARQIWHHDYVIGLNEYL